MFDIILFVYLINKSRRSGLVWHTLLVNLVHEIVIELFQQVLESDRLPVRAIWQIGLDVNLEK